MSKTISVLSIILLLILSGCAPKSELPIIKAQAVSERLDANETVVVIIGQSTCSACIQYKPVILEILSNYDVNIAYVEWDKDNRDDVSALVMNHLIAANATPTTYVFKEGKLTSTKIGYMDYRQLRTLLQEEGFIE